jgi:hypothetical protein
MSKDYLNTRDSYKTYLKTSTNPVDVSTYVKIVNGYMKFLIQKLFSKGNITLPLRLGKLQIVGKKVKVQIENGKIKGLAPDWVNTKKLWEEDPKAKKDKTLVYHFNEHTDGIRYRFFWSKARALVANKTLYDLRLTRTNKRELSSLVSSGKEYLIK